MKKKSVKKTKKKQSEKPLKLSEFKKSIGLMLKVKPTKHKK